MPPKGGTTNEETSPPSATDSREIRVMRRMIFGLALLAGALWQAPAAAQEALVHTTNTKPQKGIIKQESPRGIDFIGKKTVLIPAETITDVEYELSSTELKLTKYRPAMFQEK